MIKLKPKAMKKNGLFVAFGENKMGEQLKENKNKIKMEHWRVIILVLFCYDLFAITLSYFLALWIRFDCRFSAIPKNYLQEYYRTILVYTMFCIFLFWIMRLYKSIWRFAGYSELFRGISATIITFFIHIIFMSYSETRMPISYFVFGIFIQFVMTVGPRLSYRFLYFFQKEKSKVVENEKPVLLIGAGYSGQMVFRDIKRAEKMQERVCCFIDDNVNTWGRYIDGVPILGGRDRILEAVSNYKIEKIYLAIPSATAQQKRDILQICNETSCELMSLPGMYQLSSGELSVSKMKPIQIEDLLGRTPIKPDMKEVFDYIEGKVVLVTGVGSIGSEIARQIAAHQPKHLILFDAYENNAYEIQQELKKDYPDLKLDTIIGSVRDSRKTCHVFETYHPEIVYHAAAHKHVPLMEDSPCEAIKNNALGTYKVAYSAMVHGCKRFVLISTDKAVNPTNIMGASKRLCEMIVQGFDAKIKAGKAHEIPELFTYKMQDYMVSTNIEEALKKTKTEFVAVRFGNVLGSNGSVIPLFKKQIEAGGPVTVTHPDIIRYFMTIPEAVSLVLLAGTYAHGGEIFVLDMGEPVKIDTLARNLIRLSGYTPDEDIQIVYSGLRPGEKLYEEKLMAEEGLKKTENDLIHIGCPIPFDIDLFFKQLGEIIQITYTNSEKRIKEHTKKMVVTYHEK